MRLIFQISSKLIAYVLLASNLFVAGYWLENTLICQKLTDTISCSILILKKKTMTRALSNKLKTGKLKKEIVEGTKILKRGVSRFNHQDLARFLLKKSLRFQITVNDDDVDQLRKRQIVIFIDKMVRSMLSRTRVEHKIFHMNCSNRWWILRKLKQNKNNFKKRILASQNMKIERTSVSTEKFTRAETKTKKPSFKRSWLKRNSLLRILDFNFF